MLKNKILTAEKAVDLFGSTVDEEELRAYSDNLKNLFSETDPDRGEAFARIDALLNQRNFDTARVIEGGVKVRKSPYQILGRESYEDNVVIHDCLDKRENDMKFLFSSNPFHNSNIMKSNDHISAIRASVTKRNRVNFPEVVDTFFLTSKNGQKSLATIHSQGKSVSLASDENAVFTDEQIANIYKDMIETLRKTHDAGIIHGACYVNAWYINQDIDRVVLSDWKYSVKEGEQMWKLPETIASQGMYLSKTFNSYIPTQDTDIKLASHAAFSLTGDTNSPWLRKYLKSMADFPFASAKTVLKEFSDTYRNRMEGTGLPEELA